MKRIALLLCVLMLVGLWGCAGQSEMPATEPAVTAAVTEPVPETKPTDPQPAAVIETKYYSLPLFDEWAERCQYEVFQMESGLYVLSLYETTSHEQFGGGKLCSIQLMPAGDDTYKDFPSYEWLGELDTPDGRFNVIVLFPTDVQFTEDTANTYAELFSNIHDLLYTLSPREGVELMMPAPAV